MSPVDQATQLNNIQDAVLEIRSTLANDQVFNVLGIIRDEVNDLSRQHESIRADIRDLRSTVAATGAD